MLSHEQNTLLTRVEGDAPMGRMLRKHYWVPAMRAGRLQADGAPQRIRLFGRNLVAFRATDGRLGVFDERCPHRGVSLLLARNEDCALRCIFHGMKFHVSGEVVEVPTHFGDPRTQPRIRLRHYPVREAGGLVWVWMGDEGEPPPFPEFEFMGLPESHLNVRIQQMHCNFVQGIEATIDSSHVGILHADWVGKVGELALTAENAAPRYDVKFTPYGMRAAALRSMQDGRDYTRITEFVFPYYSFIPPSGMQGGDRLTIISVPVDDEHAMQLYLRYNIRKPISHDDWKALADPDDFNPIQGDWKNAWGQDRASMKQGSFSGFSSLPLEDFAMQVSMGAIADRTTEQLIGGDYVIVRARRLFLQQVERFVQGEPPTVLPQQAEPLRAVRSYSLMTAREADWAAPATVADAA